ncbi:hypothetical protein DL98DRAFT_619824 [Cadophora sp. DSE1049]|nr:hypothetical protein DL98DRAFT_619824 [Cadophora sp. DSE1049]
MEKAPSTTSAASLAGSATPRALVSFTCFLKLPPELRTMIWEAAANQPRNVDIWARDDEPCEEWRLKENLDTMEYTPFKFWTTQPVPGILHASSESRQIGLKFYQLSFGIKRWPEEMPGSKAPRIYRNFAADRICPMEELRPAPHLELFCSSEHPLASCAFNLHRRK